MDTNKPENQFQEVTRKARIFREQLRQNSESRKERTEKETARDGADYDKKEQPNSI